MRPAIEVNRHRGLAPDELTRKYRHARDADHEDRYAFYDEDFDHCYDDHWDPWSGRTADDYLLLDGLEESIGFTRRRPKLGELLPGSLARLVSGAPAPAPPREARPSHAPEALAEALFMHERRLLHLSRSHPFAYGDELTETLVRINGGMAGVAEAFRRFEARPGPVVMALLFAPFWVRPLASWCPPEGDDPAVTRSLIGHLFQVYPAPRPLHQPWLAGTLPSLKWVSWLILLGQGGNLHRAARRFGWGIPKRFTHLFAAAPEDLTPLEACMWSEIARLGGHWVDFERLRRNPAYALDPTELPVPVPEHDPEPGPYSAWDEQRDQADRVARTRAFWHQTVEWLVRWRDQLTDEASAAILEWAMHLHTESIRRGDLPGPRFTWRGREPASAHAAALEYRRQRATPYGDLTWRARGLDWASGEGEPIAWAVQELTSSKALAEESRAMHHCVASYARRCAQGYTAIFSLCADGVRKITVELDPFRHDIVQARGACNRAATAEEQAILTRWLAATSPVRRKVGGMG